ncbi:hypothetical protein MNBD_IGNAVI01-2300 [hydrothermal vent metagenome]|uniref:Uncharacterized protein n=1 Tax=hydrothermal vent metagenome TaxID=652676 RepID=A0A3B1CA96_9ZZZZ
MKTFLLIIFLFTSVIFSQKMKENWIPIDTKGSDKVYIDIAGIENFTGDDIFVWVLTEHATPITIESIDSKISKTKSYYLMNKRLMKYSILYIIYYDNANNVLASYDYNRNTNVEVYQYNYPIWDNTVEYSILKKCLEIIDAANKKVGEK